MSMIEQEIRDFINNFEDKNVCDDDFEQNIAICDKVEKVNFHTFAHITNDSQTDVKQCSIYPLATLWPDTDGSIFIGENENGRLVSYDIDSGTFKTSICDAVDLMILINDKVDNRTIYDILFADPRKYDFNL